MKKSIFTFASTILVAFSMNAQKVEFEEYDLDNGMRGVFYPAVLGWILFCFWLTNVKIRLKRVSKVLDKKQDKFYESIL